MEGEARRVNVYKDGQIIDSLELPPLDIFINDFLIAESSETGLYWRVEEDSRERIRKRLQGQKPQGGVLQIWLNGMVFQLIPRDWELWINGKRYKTRPRQKVAVKWPKVELIYQSYRFEFLFPMFDSNANVEIPFALAEEPS